MNNNAKTAAFPVLETAESFPSDRGLTKLEWFAGQAMQGLLASAARDYPLPEPPIIASYVVGCAKALVEELANG